jgi:hypothetical protein
MGDDVAVAVAAGAEGGLAEAIALGAVSGSGASSAGFPSSAA